MIVRTMASACVVDLTLQEEHRVGHHEQNGAIASNWVYDYRDYCRSSAVYVPITVFQGPKQHMSIVCQASIL